MKKIFILVLLPIMALSLGACGQKKTAGPEKLEPAKSLAAWLSGADDVICTIAAPDGEVVIKQKGEKVRMEGVPYMPFDLSGESGAPRPGISLFDDEWLYMWADDSGTKMNMTVLEELGEEMGGGSQAKDFSEIVREYEQAGIAHDCRSARLSDSEFEVPSNVDFADLTEMITGMAGMAADLQESMRAAGIDPDNMDDLSPEQLSDMMRGMSGQ